jgi:hypothetical protein
VSGLQADAEGLRELITREILDTRGENDPGGQFRVPAPQLFRSKCVNCNKITIGYQQEIIYPVTPPAPVPDKDMHGEVKADYPDAREIAEKPPGAAVALF